MMKILNIVFNLLGFSLIDTLNSGIFLRTHASQEKSPSNYPYFEYNVPRNVTTVVGRTAFLHCRVEELGDKEIAWIRKRDLHILTVGISTYTTDQRFQVIRPEKSSNWTLQIKFPQLRDSGIYECQVNTEPKLCLPFKLNVIEARARIIGSTDIHVKVGSSVTLVCNVNKGPHDLGSIRWYKENKTLQLDNEIDQRVVIQNVWNEELTSNLHIVNVLLSDTGKYSCVPTMSIPAHVNLHVINGEHPAAMQHEISNLATAPIQSHFGSFYAVILLAMCRIR